MHGTLPALKAVLACLQQRRPDLIFCLDDLVGYVPWPNEAVNEVRRRRIPTLAVATKALGWPTRTVPIN